ncbi:hypothetical protein ACFPYJ_12215 [Paenibacillus solisilvae]|uniref:Uncharacterized protein n=1 Tax=Paenibacillus solisilvae TaxID=2486751 RepID=A0ABW0VYG0_9BACL
MEFIPFMIFSMFDCLALIIVVLTIYRFRLRDCLWPALLVAGVMSLQSFFLREELSNLSDLVPFLNALILALLLTIFLEVPFHWSLIGSFVGYFLYILLQAGISELSFGFLSVQELHSDPVKGYMFQIIVSVIAFLICKFLFSRGIGLATNFKKRLKGEPIIVGIAIILATCLFGIMLIKHEVLLDLVLVSVAMVFFLVILIKKEVSK